MTPTASVIQPENENVHQFRDLGINYEISAVVAEDYHVCDELTIDQLQNISKFLICSSTGVDKSKSGRANLL